MGTHIELATLERNRYFYKRALRIMDFDWSFCFSQVWGHGKWKALGKTNCVQNVIDATTNTETVMVSRERCATSHLAACLLRGKNLVKTVCSAILTSPLRGIRILRGKTKYARYLFWLVFLRIILLGYFLVIFHMLLHANFFWGRKTDVSRQVRTTSHLAAHCLRGKITFKMVCSAI